MADPPRPASLCRAWVRRALGLDWNGGGNENLVPPPTGEECPRPGRWTFHLTFSDSSKPNGASPRAIPSFAGPRQDDQSWALSGAAPANRPTTATITTHALDRICKGGVISFLVLRKYYIHTAGSGLARFPPVGRRNRRARVVTIRVSCRVVGLRFPARSAVYRTTSSRWSDCD